MKFDSIGVSRHRIGSDGVGVTTLVGGCGCPLDCAYCLNPQCKLKPYKSFGIEELFTIIDADSLYFSATGGGVCFGGGEPLLQSSFIRDFIIFSKEQGRDWKFTLETCLSVPLDNLTGLDGLIDFYIVDIKDMNEEIYQNYTGKSICAMMECLANLSKTPERVKIKIPLIPGYNDATSVTRSKKELEEMGFFHLETFRYITKIEKKKILSDKTVDNNEKI